MSDSLITKKALAGSIKQLMETVPLAKISIQNIVDNCGLNRKTFYYHFKDKFDLVNWIYYREVSERIDDYKHYENWVDGTYRILTYISENKSFYVNAQNTHGQNSFEEYFSKFCFEIVMGAINELSVDMNVSEHDKKFVADFYIRAFVSITIDWIKHGMKDSPKSIVDGIRNIIEGSMPDALMKYQNSGCA